MKFMFGEYEIDIKAKYSASEKSNKADTMSVLCQLAIYAGEAADRLEQRGCPTLAEKARAHRNEIHDFLDRNHYFDNLRNFDE